MISQPGYFVPPAPSSPPSSSPLQCCAEAVRHPHTSLVSVARGGSEVRSPGQAFTCAACQSRVSSMAPASPPLTTVGSDGDSGSALRSGPAHSSMQTVPVLCTGLASMPCSTPNSRDSARAGFLGGWARRLPSTLPTATSRLQCTEVHEHFGSLTTSPAHSTHSAPCRRHRHVCSFTHTHPGHCLHLSPDGSSSGAQDIAKQEKLLHGVAHCLK